MNILTTTLILLFIMFMFYLYDKKFNKESVSSNGESYEERDSMNNPRPSDDNEPRENTSP